MVLKMIVEQQLENQFRELAMRRYGFSKGALQKASCEAMKRWIKEEERKLPVVESPIGLIKGIMKHLRGKYTSVQLQHEAVKVWIKEK